MTFRAKSIIGGRRWQRGLCIGVLLLGVSRALWADVSTSGAAAFDDNGRIFDGPERGYIVDENARSLSDPVYDPVAAGDPGSVPNRAALFQMYIPWKELEPQSGQFDFTRIDALMAGLHQLGKRAIWRLDCSMGDSTKHDSGYPQWLLDFISDSDKRTIDSKPGRPGSIEISYENLDFQKYLTRFIQTLAQRYDGSPDLEYVDLRVVGRFGEWGGWHDADNFPFQTKRETLKRFIDLYGHAFTRTKLTMEVAGRTHEGDPIQDLTSWDYDLIWNGPYSNFIIRTDTDSASADFISGGWYPEDKMLTGWLFERFTARLAATYEGVGTWFDYKRTVYSPDRFYDNALYRLRTNYGYVNNMDAAASWPRFFEPIFGEAADRLERNFAYRVRPACVSWRTEQSGGKSWLQVDQSWVNAGVGHAPHNFYPAISIVDPDSGKELLHHVLQIPAAQLSDIRNSDFVELRSTLELPTWAGQRLRLQLAAENPTTGQKLELPVDAAGDGRDLPVATLPLPVGDHSAGAEAGDMLLAMSHTYEAEAAWQIRNATVVRSPKGGPISPRLEKVAHCQNAVLVWQGVNAPEDGDYQLALDVQSDNAAEIQIDVDGTQGEIAVDPTGSPGSNNPPVKFSTTLRLAQGNHVVTVKTPTIEGDLSMDRLRIEKVATGGQELAPAIWTLPATRLAQTSTQEVPIGTMPWWNDYGGMLSHHIEMARGVDASSPVATPDVHVRKDPNGYHLEGFRAGSWFQMAPLYVQAAGNYCATIKATIAGAPPKIQTLLDGYPVAEGVLQPRSDGMCELASQLRLEGGVHEIGFNVLTSDGNWTLKKVALETEPSR